MRIQTLSVIFLSTIFISFSIVIWIFSNNLIMTINEKWGEQYVKNQIFFDRYHTLLPILNEVSLVRQMAKDPDLIAMSINEEDSEIKQKAITVLEDFRNRFNDKSYFVAFAKTGHYYFNDSYNSRVNNYLGYTLSEKQKDDEWFYKAIKHKNEYQINVNKDTILGTTKVWINYILHSTEDEVLGIVGTGLTLDSFLNQSMGFEQKGIHNFFINDDLDIQLEKNQTMIDYASVKNIEQKNLKHIFGNPKDISSIKELMKILKKIDNEDNIKTIWLTIDGQKKLFCMAYLKDLDWYSLTILNSDVLAISQENRVFNVLIILFLLSLFILYFFNKVVFLNPLNQLKQNIQSIKEKNFNVNVLLVGYGEIKELSYQFKSMVEIIQKNNQQLEEKIKERTETLALNKQMLDTVLDNIHAYVFVKDTDYCYRYVNKSIIDSFGIPIEEIIGKNDSDFFDNETFKILRNNDIKVITQGKKNENQEFIIKKEDKKIIYSSVKVPLFNTNGDIYALCGITIDITRQKQIEKEIKELAFYDTLTELPNRRLLIDRLEQSLITSKRSRMYGALMFLDLDNFKLINDTYGHHVGDLMLIEAAQRIKNCLRESETVARFGGDEFVVLLSNVDEDKNITVSKVNIIAEKIKETLVRPYELRVEFNNEIIDITHQSSGSIGITIFLGNTTTKENILRFSDQAMYNAKKSGRNQIKYHNI